MNKKEEFKKFIISHPELVSYIQSKEYTWQDFYEVYDIYGENPEVWNKYQTSDDDRSAKVSELTNLVKTINMDNVQKYINNAQKAINVIQELTSKNPVTGPTIPTKTPRPITKFFGD